MMESIWQISSKHHGSSREGHAARPLAPPPADKSFPCKLNSGSLDSRPRTTARGKPAAAIPAILTSSACFFSLPWPLAGCTGFAFCLACKPLYAAASASVFRGLDWNSSAYAASRMPTSSRDERRKRRLISPKPLNPLRMRRVEGVPAMMSPAQLVPETRPHSSCSAPLSHFSFSIA
ncbi:hypothetical protein HDK64DRAFT_84390, partial [Phyllosticta capitalensis]